MARIFSELLRNRDNSLEIHEEILRILEVYDEYAVKLQEFKSYPDKIQNSLYSIKFVLKDDVQTLVERLMSPGFSIKPGITLLFDTVSPREAFETLIHTKLNAIKKIISFLKE